MRAILALLIVLAFLVSGCVQQTETPLEGVKETPESPPEVEVPETPPETPGETPKVQEIPKGKIQIYEMGVSNYKFSYPKLSVKKGDTVSIKITNTEGTHSFNIDEFDVHEDLPLNQEVVVEFVADKAGKFQYYCSVENHRELGMVGTLEVKE